MSLRIAPITISAANDYIRDHHRHHIPKWVTNYFAVSCRDADDELRGVAIIGRPSARALCDGRTAEVTRLCTDGSRNACSMLYAAAWRASRALGYQRLITYILESEPGTSLRAAGWRYVGQTKGGSWNTPSRPRVDKAPVGKKQRWEVAEK